MLISEVNYINFRNLEDNNLKFNSKFNLFIGKNGQGKTSILEAIYFSATGKSFRTSKNQELIKYSKLKTGVYNEYIDNISSKSVSVKLGSSKKEYSYNKKRVKYDTFHGKINIVSFIPEDINLIIGSPSIRRSFFNYEIAQSNYEYYENLKKYEKVLKVRNRYLKEGKYKDPMFLIYQDEFIETACKIIKKRIDYIKNISIILNLNYRKLFDEKKELSLMYNSFFKPDKNMSIDKIKNLFLEEMKRVESREKRYGYSMIGPQKDDFIFLLDGREAKSYASQGEKKSVIFSLKLAEIDMIIKETKEIPVFLIDDISSYFDSIRKDNILSYFKKRNIQLFISSTNDLNIESKKFVIDKGDIYESSEEC